MTAFITAGAPLLLFSLLVGALSQGRWSNGWAAAVLPGVLVVTAAQFTAVSGPLAAGGVFALATAVAWAGVLPAPVSVLVSNAVGSGVVIGVALAASRFVASLAPLAAPVVMALVLAGLETLGSRASPFGEWGSMAHTQTRRRWARAVARRGPHLVTAVLVFTSSAFGFAVTERSTALLVLALAAVASLTAVGISATRRAPSRGVSVVGLLEDDESFFAAHVRPFVSGGTETDAWWSTFAEASAHQLDGLLERTRSAGLGGADLIVWAEGAGLVSATRHAQALDAAAEVARSTSTYLVASWLVLNRETAKMDNVCTVFDAAGTLVLTTAKQFPVPGPEAARTTPRPPGDLGAVDTPFGRLAVIICFDADHAESWRQVARSGADLVAIPASDWPAIGVLHADMALLRAQSVGAAVVRPSRNGVSRIVTAGGDVVGERDHRSGNAPPLRGTL